MIGVWWPAVAVFLFSVALTFLMIQVAHKVGFIHRPKGERWSSRPVAMGGGIALFLAWLVGAGFWVGLERWEALAAVAVMFCLGLWDDFFSLSPRVKLFVEISVAGFLISRGWRFELGFEVISIFVTLLWIIGITNATNLLDNMDGISAGTSAVALLAASVIGSLLYPDDPMAAFSMIAAGAAAGFLIFNFAPAKIYMGDSGSLSLGMMVALSVLFASKERSSGWETVFLAALVCWVPIFDTTLVTVARLLEGRPVALGGRDHITHRLFGLGFTERHVAVTLWSVTILTGVWAITVWLGRAQFSGFIFGAWILVTVCLGYFFLKRKTPVNVK